MCVTQGDPSPLFWLLLEPVLKCPLQSVAAYFSILYITASDIVTTCLMLTHADTLANAYTHRNKNTRAYTYAYFLVI